MRASIGLSFPNITSLQHFTLMSNQKACSSASSDLVESMLLALSSTEELDMMGVEAHVVSEPAYSNSEELVEVMTHDMASSLKSPVLLSKPCWFTSRLVGKAYGAAGQDGGALHIMAVLQVYQDDLLKDSDLREGVSPESVLELCHRLCPPCHQAGGLYYRLLSCCHGFHGGIFG